MDFEPGLCRNSSCLSSDPGNQFILVLFQVTRSLSQDCGSPLITGRRPSGLSRASFHSRFSHVGRRGVANLSEPFAGRRFEDVERSSRRAAPLSAEQPSAPSALNHELRRRYVHFDLPPRRVNETVQHGHRQLSANPTARNIHTTIARGNVTPCAGPTLSPINFR